MKKIQFKTLRARLTFWFLILSLIPLFIGILTSFYQEKRVLERETFSKLISIRDLKVQQLEKWINERFGDMHVMVGDIEIRGLENIIEKKSKSPDDIIKIEIARELLIRNQVNYNVYTEIFIIGANNGLVEISSNRDFEAYNKSKNLHFTVPLETGEIYIKDIYFSRTLNRPEMTISSPIYCLEHNTHIIGVLVARIDLEKSLYNLLLNRVGLGETGETLIVNKDVMALSQLRWYENAPLNLKILAEPALKAAKGETGTIITTDYHGEHVKAAYTYIPETGWGFICKQDLHELNAPIRDLMKSFVVLLIVSALVIVLIVFWITKRISTPIVEMDMATRQIKSGDYSVRTVVSSRDELASLANSINEMSVSIESRINTRKAVADISETMRGQSSMQEFGPELLKQLMKITRANMSVFYILNDATTEYEHFASIGANPKLLSPFNAQNPEGEIGNAISKKNIYYLQNIPEETIFKFKTSAGDAIPKEIITIPVLVENTVVALISLVNIKKFNKECYDILKQSWSAINTSYSNLMAGERTRIFAEQLAKINQQLEAQTEELQNQTEELQQASEELEEQNLELDTQKKQVEEANKLKSEFLSNMSHELRTPLNSIMALSRVLITQAKGKLNDEEINYLEIVERNGKRLLSLINDILDLSKIEAGKTEIMLELISVDLLLKLIRENMQTLSGEKGLTTNLFIPENLPKVETDQSRLHQVFSNIIGNAIKFTEKGSVDITATYDLINVFIEVKDTGIGISKKVLPYIFEEFRQADGSSSRKYEGTGLGLAIANKMIKVIGGDINVKSELGKGSVFTISIPIKWFEEILPAYGNNIETQQLKTKDSTISTDDENIKTDKDTSGTRILIVEDNEDAVIQIMAVMKNEGYKIDVATGGQEVLDYLQHTIPDGIILDLMMPDVNGFEVLEKIRKTQKTEKIPVLVLTAKNLTREDLSKLSTNNVHQLIHKGDVDIEGLLNKVKFMLSYESKAKGNIVVEKKKKGKRAGMPNILIVEDNPDNMITIKAILKGKYNITEAVDSKEGLKIIQSQTPDIILMDMLLPKMEGEKIVKTLKANNETKNIPIIAITAQAMKGDQEGFLKAGCDGYVAKPIDQGALLAEIGRLLSGVSS